MTDNEMFGDLPAVLTDPATRLLLNWVGDQVAARGYALLFPRDITEMDRIQELARAGLVTTSRDSVRLNHVGESLSTEIICTLTDSGRVATSIIAPEA